MTSHVVLGQPALFQLTDTAELPEDMSERERRLLVGALNFHALMAPERDLLVHAYDGGNESLPRTTEDSTFTGMSRAYSARLFSLRMRSDVLTEKRTSIEAEDEANALISTPYRHVHISRDDVLAYDPPRDVARDPLRRVMRKVRTRYPLLYDELRDIELRRYREQIATPAQRRRYADEFLPGGHHEDSSIVPAPQPPDGAPRAVLFGLHWFELGGAERWAFETVRIAREAGYLPIVLTNRDSHQPWITRSELDGALVIPFSEHTVHSQTPGIEQVLRAILRTFDVRGVVVHHNQWLYDRLPWIVASRPGIPIVDSTHIVEHRGGGYPRSSVIADPSITTHHVISPNLASWMTDVQRVDSGKVIMAPLGGLTVSARDADFRPRADGAPFVVAFIGRMSRQKAPEVFCAAAERLHALDPHMRFVMHGDGEMSGWVDELIAAHGLVAVTTRRDSSISVEHTFREAHVLAVTSHNEGLTLTTLEAVAHGVPVVSTDVGAQSDVVPEAGLVTSRVTRSVAEFVDRILALSRDEEVRRRLWSAERAAEKALLAHRSASEWFTEEVAGW